MSEHRASVEWTRSGDFHYETYSRSHVIDFGGELRVPGNAARENVPRTAAGVPGVNPEQGFVGALSACHMLWFLHLACNRKLAVERYRDEAVGVLEKNGEGKGAITRVTLRPVVSFAGAPPSPEHFVELHVKAHERCFIANSVKTEIVLQPSIG